MVFVRMLVAVVDAQQDEVGDPPLYVGVRERL